MISGQAELAAKDALTPASAGERVEHVEKDKTRKRHSGVASVDCMVDRHLTDIYSEGAEHDDGSRSEDSLDDRTCEDARRLGTRGTVHH